MVLAMRVVAPDARLPSAVAAGQSLAPPSQRSAPLDNSHNLYVLDGHGLVHPVAGAPQLSTSVTWPNKDVAYSLALFADGSGGYVLNAWGGLDAVGDAPVIDIGLSSLGFGVVRAVVLAPWASKSDAAGYVLDANGVLHEFGDAPVIKRWTPFTAAVARGVALLPMSNRHRVMGYVVDASGGVHAFGGAPAVAMAPLWPGQDVARGIVLAPAGGGYVLDEFGGLHPFGGAPDVGAAAIWPGQDLADSVVAWSLAPASSPGGWILDRHGALHTYGLAPMLESGVSWPSWDIARGLGSPGGAGGGSKERTLVDPEALADGWGAYFNQRDARWGRNSMGASGWPVWEFGCLMTDLAMVYSHFGYRGVTPATIAADAGAFHWDATMVDGALSVPGHPALINRRPSLAWIRAQLAAGRPVIVGMDLPGGGTHFVVLTALNGASDFWANDPWDQNGMHVQFSGDWDDRGTIYEAIAYP